MKQFSDIFNISLLKANIKQAFERFPIAIFLSAGISALFLYLIYHQNIDQQYMLQIGKIICSLIVTFFLSVGVTLLSESLQKNKNILFGLQILPFLFGILFYSFFQSDFSDSFTITYIIITLFGVVFFLFFAPYLSKIFKKDFMEHAYYTYFYKISTVFLLSIILGGVLFILGMIGITTVYNLFDLGYMHQDKIIGTWATLALCFITPLFALTQLPRKEDFFSEYFNEHTFFSFIIRFVVIPFVFIYFIILYAYSIKVLLNFGDWPKGEVSWMVIGFSVLGYIAYIFSYIYEEKNSLIHLFRKYFPYVVIPQLAMLFYAIYLRIAQYDLTINRYLIVIFGIWLLSISLYYIISREKRLIAIPSIITLFTILISIGPWSVYQLPFTRQTQRLKENLVLAGICNDDMCTIVTPLKNQDDISQDLSENIYSGIRYVCEFDNCSVIKELFAREYDEIYVTSQKEYESGQKNIPEKEQMPYTEPNTWEIISHLAEKLNIQTNYYDSGVTGYIQYENYENLFPIDISGYRFIEEMNYYPYNENMSGSILTLEDIGGEDYQIDFAPILKDIREKYEEGNLGDDTENRYKYIGENFMFIPRYIYIPIKKESQDEYNSESMDGYILIK